MDELKRLLIIKTNLDKTDLPNYVNQCNIINKEMRELIMKPRPLKKVDINLLLPNTANGTFDISGLDPEVLSEFDNNFESYAFPDRLAYYNELLKKNQIQVGFYIPALLNVMSRKNYKCIDRKIHKCNLRLIFQYSNDPIKIYISKQSRAANFSWYEMNFIIQSSTDHRSNCIGKTCNMLKHNYNISYRYAECEEETWEPKQLISN